MAGTETQPMCFDTKEWLRWQFFDRRVDKHEIPCADCTPEFRGEMLHLDRCYVYTTKLIAGRVGGRSGLTDGR